jgi:hypothetical protein
VDEVLDWRRSSHAIYLNSERPISSKVGRSRRYLDAEPGYWGVAVPAEGIKKRLLTESAAAELGAIPCRCLLVWHDLCYKSHEDALRQSD